MKDLKCSFCGFDLLQYSTASQRIQHYEIHLAEADSASPNTPNETYIQDTSNDKQTSSRNSMTRRKSFFRPVETDRFWCLANKIEPPRCFTPGLIPLLREVLLRAQSRGELHRAVLCYERAVHVGREPWDSSWGCGYRNFLMACIVLMDQPYQPSYSELLSHPIYPSIRNLQRWIEEAWSFGFDEEGAKQLKKLIGTKKWIGTGDLWVAFVYRGIPVELVDFNLKNKRNGTELVLKWIVDYFTPQQAPNANLYETLSNASPVVQTDRMPIIMQYAGHSRTIIGYKVDKKGRVSLLTFDPSRVVSQELRNTAMECFHNTGDHKRLKPDDNGQKPSATKDVPSKNTLKQFVVDDRALRSKDHYQILYFPMTNPLSEAERQKKKTVISTNIDRVDAMYKVTI